MICNDKAYFTIIDREIRVIPERKNGKMSNINHKYYKYKCHSCGYNNGWKLEKEIRRSGCPCCSGNIAVKGINTVADKRPDLLQYFVDIKDAYEHTIGSNYEAQLQCPICGKQRQMYIRTLTQRGLICNQCGDGISYPEKFIMSFLRQAGKEYQYQLSKKDFKWCDKYKYDFYISNSKCIIEVNGEQHYCKEFTNKGAKSLEEVQKIDKIKENLALSNGIKQYISINCSKSEIDTIKKGIIESNICNILNIDMENIDFIQCAIDANKNLMKEVCAFYNQNQDMTPTMIAPYFNVNRVTILDYLKKGTKLGLCHYDVEKAKVDSRIKGAHVTAQKRSKPLAAYDSENKFIGEFVNARYAAEYFKENFDIKLNTSNIHDVCAGRHKHHKGFIFRYIDKTN